MNEIKICLCMIIKNESKIIKRCIHAAIEAADIDAICICDTGSTDNTVEELKNEKWSIPFHIAHDESQKFVDFGTNRTLSFTTARKYTTKTLHWDPLQSYALLLDADMVLKRGESFDKSKLNDYGYMIYQVNGNLIYENVRLIRFAEEWVCREKTHEYWSCATPQKHSMQKLELEFLHIDDQNDGGCKLDKFQRDIRLLSSTIEEDPTNHRAYYYLGQSYEGCSDFKNAIHYYEERRNFMDKFPEEAWYALYAIGKCYLTWYEISNDKKEKQILMQKGTFAHLQAFEERPHRAEPLWALSYFYRVIGKQQLSYMFAMQGLKIGFPSNDILFVDYTVYQYQLIYELSIVCYYSLEKYAKRFGLFFCDYLIMNYFQSTKSKVPQHIYENALSNTPFYVENMFPKGKNTIDLSDVWDYKKHWKDRNGEQFRPLNPCITEFQNKPLVNVRFANFQVDPKTNTYTSRCPSGIVSTRNVLLFFENNSSFEHYSDWKEIVDVVGGEHKDATVQGIEDLRIFEHANILFGLGNSRMDPYNQPQMVLCLIDLKTDHSHKATIYKKFILDTPHHSNGENTCEKNWTPIVSICPSRIYLRYKHDSLKDLCLFIEIEELLREEKRISRKTLEDACYYQEKDTFPLRCLTRFRGSSQTILLPEYMETMLMTSIEKMSVNFNFNDHTDFHFLKQCRYPICGAGILEMAITHEVLFLPSDVKDGAIKRVYLHRFVFYSDNVPLHVSAPFSLTGKSIEYCCGIYNDHEKKRIYLSCGIEDEKAQLFWISYRGLLKFIETRSVEGLFEKD